MKRDLADKAADNDPAIGLRAASELRRLAERLEYLQVKHARDLGWSWSEIAALLGLTKQAVHHKYAKQLASEGSD